MPRPDRKASARSREPYLRLRLRLLVATVTGIAAGFTRPIAERLFDWLIN
jgi:hypothetical protein